MARHGRGIARHQAGEHDLGGHDPGGYHPDDQDLDDQDLEGHDVYGHGRHAPYPAGRGPVDPGRVGPVRGRFSEYIAGLDSDDPDDDSDGDPDDDLDDGRARAPASGSRRARRRSRRAGGTFWSETRLLLAVFVVVMTTLVILAVTTDLDEPGENLGTGPARIGASGEDPGSPATSASAAGEPGDQAAGGVADDPAGEARLVWSDEFDGPAGVGPDPRIWTPRTGYGWGIDEMQCYTSDPRNLAMDGQGSLVINMLREPSCEGAQFSSARIDTLGKKSMHYGYLEVRALLPTRTGAFPAVWLMGTDMPEVGWPAAGEIDVVEAAAPSPTLAFTNVHGIDANGKHWEATWGNGGIHDAGVNLADGFHTYGLEWTSDRLRFYFDGKLTRTITRDQVPVWLWDKPNYLLMNAAILPTGAQAAPSDYPQRMMIDYVRVYSRKP